MFTAVSGLLAGAAHVVTGPDHLAAVAPFAVERRRSYSAAWVGATWGLGHGTGVLVLGALGQLFKAGLGLETVSGWAERLVGVLLVGVGLWTLHRANKLVIHEHTHVHDGGEHTHLHLHQAPARSQRRFHSHSPHEHTHAPLGIGALHGLAGSNHLFAVMPSLAMDGTEAAFYLVGYLAAAIVAMASFGALVGSLLRVAGSEKIPLALRGAGWACLVVGGVWIGLGVA